MSKNKCVAYLANGDRAPLQYKGLCPSRAKYVESPCFSGIDGGRNDAEFEDTPEFNLQNIQVSLNIRRTARNGYCEIFGLQQKDGTSRGLALIHSYAPAEFQIRYSDGTSNVDVYTGYEMVVSEEFVHMVVKHTTSYNILIVDGVEVFREAHADTIGYGGANPTNHLCGGINFAMEHDVYDIQISEIDPITEEVVNVISRYPLSEPIADPSNHTYHDVVGNNHATLINGSMDNFGLQDEFHYGELGYFITGGYNESTSTLITPERDWLEVGESFKCKFVTDSAATQVLWGRDDTDNYIALRTDLGAINMRINDAQVFMGSGAFVLGEVCDLTITRESEYDYRIKTDLVDVVGTHTQLMPVGGFKYVGSRNPDSPTPFQGTMWNIQVKDMYIPTPYDGVIVDSTEVCEPVNISKGFTVPASATNSDLDALGNPLTVTQDGKSFLGTCKMQHEQMARVVQADSGNLWFNTDGTPKQLTADDLVGNYLDYAFADKSENTSNVRTHISILENRQLLTELNITNND